MHNPPEMLDLMIHAYVTVSVSGNTRRRRLATPLPISDIALRIRQ